MQTRRQVRQSARSWVILFVILHLMGLISPSRCWSAPAAAINVSAGPEANEDLFLLYLLPVQYEAVQQACSTPNLPEMMRRLAEVRANCVKVQVHVQSAKVDQRVPQLFTDLVSLIDAFEQLVIDLDRDVGAIRREAAAKSSHAAIETGAKAANAYNRLTRVVTEAVIVDPQQAATTAAIGGVAGSLHGLIDYVASFAKQNADTTFLLKTKMADLRHLSDTLRARAEMASKELVRDRGWSDVEMASEDSAQRATRYAAALQSKDYSEALRLIRQVVVFNPRSFFAHQAEETILASWTNRTPQQRLESAKHLNSACRLVPDAAIYEEYRVSALQDAAWLCVEALVEESRSAGRHWQPNDTSSYAVAVLEETVRRASPASRPVLNWLLAMAYGANHQFAAAEKLTESLRSVETLLAEQVPGTAGSLDFIQACIDSRQGETPSALKFLQKAVGGGWAVSKDWWEDADLEALRTAHPKEFAELLAVKASWTIDFGVLRDDVVVRNDSPFAVSGVRVNVGVVSKGKRHDRELKAEAIAPGKVHRWSNVFSIPRDPELAGVLLLESEQTPSAVTATFLAPSP